MQPNRTGCRVAQNQSVETVRAEKPLWELGEFVWFHVVAMDLLDF